jgi:CHAT domain-containing protein
MLLLPLANELGDRELVIVPTGPLHALPWPALPGCAGRAVSVAPSAALWHRAATGPLETDGHRVFAAGPDLPHATAEVAALARRRAGARLTGRRARVDAVASALDGAGLGHIAAHGSFRADNPLFSALHLADGPLTVYDLERLGRPPRHLVLSACDSGLPAVHPGDELLGLTAALLGLGTRSLVATVVPVPDRTSRPLMLRLHHHLDAGLGPAAALTRAQLDVARRDDVTARVTALGFVCFGAG